LELISRDISLNSHSCESSVGVEAEEVGQTRRVRVFLGKVHGNVVPHILLRILKELELVEVEPELVVYDAENIRKSL